VKPTSEHVSMVPRQVACAQLHVTKLEDEDGPDDSDLAFHHTHLHGVRLPEPSGPTGSRALQELIHSSWLWTAQGRSAATKMGQGSADSPQQAHDDGGQASLANLDAHAMPSARHCAAAGDELKSEDASL
jgi:hypothetical protein